MGDAATAVEKAEAEFGKCDDEMKKHKMPLDAAKKQAADLSAKKQAADTRLTKAEEIAAGVDEELPPEAFATVQPSSAEESASPKGHRDRTSTGDRTKTMPKPKLIVVDGNGTL